MVMTASATRQLINSYPTEENNVNTRRGYSAGMKECNDLLISLLHLLEHEDK
jgi:hypothetical protein